MAGLYIHIPFCRSKCAYCDFYSMPGHADLQLSYVDSLIKEANLRSGEIKEHFSTLYLGGGTPSTLSTEALSKLMEGIDKSLGLPEGERTIEANPDDISTEFLNIISSLGFNRVSIGVQSFYDNTLRLINRSHTSKVALAALELLTGNGWNFSADLIYGLPGETINHFEQSLSILLKFNPAHLSAYALMIEERTRLWAMLRSGKIKEWEDEEFQAAYYSLCSIMRQQGYSHYEISNFSLPGREAEHNCRYWDFTPYLGLGPGAHSFDGKIRRYNPSNLKEYISRLKSGNTCFESEEETEKDFLNDYIFTSLRTSKGLNKQFLQNYFPEYYESLWERLSSHSSIEITGCYARIPEYNWLVSDAIIRDLLIS